MSDNFLRFVPVNPESSPGDAETAAGIEVLVAAFPDSDVVEAESHDSVQFIDCGGNFESVRCPQCRADLLEDGSWGQMMNTARASGMAERRFDLPCCGASTALEDLAYFWPVAFGRLSLDVRNPGVRCFHSDGEPSEFENALLSKLRTALGTEVSAHWQHL